MKTKKIKAILRKRVGARTFHFYEAQECEASAIARLKFLQKLTPFGEFTIVSATITYASPIIKRKKK